MTIHETLSKKKSRIKNRILSAKHTPAKQVLCRSKLKHTSPLEFLKKSDKKKQSKRINIADRHENLFI